MAGRPRKRLLDHVLEGSFLARQHGGLLADKDDLPWPGFAALQAEYRRARSVPEQRAVALDFERLVRGVRAQADELGIAPLAPSLDDTLAALGPTDSLKQVVGFFPRFLRHYQSSGSAGKPFRLAPFQRAFLGEFWRRDRHGQRVYQVGLLGIPKGNGKTPFAAGLGLHALVSCQNSPDVYGIAGSKKQAEIAHSFAERWAADSDLGLWLKNGKTIRCPERHGAYTILSSDGRLAQGVNPSAAIVDEWWLFDHARERESFNALAHALHKRAGEAWLLAITTAGWNKHSQLGETFTAALKHPKLETHRDGHLLILRDTSSGFLMHWFGLPDGSSGDIENPQLIRACNPASWVSPRALIRELHRPDTDENDWRRLHLNEWTASRESWLPSGCWASLGSDAAIPDNAEIYVGVDVGWTHDSTAVVWAQRLDDDRIALRSHVWTTDPDDSALRAGRGHDTIQFVAGGKMRLALVEEFIRELAARYKLRELSYDPSYFGRSAEILEHEGITTVEFLPFSAPMRAAWQSFYQAAVEGKISHDRDPVLAAHVDAAAADRTEAGWKVRKLKSTSRIDALAAAVMAHARAQLDTGRNNGGPQIFWMEV
jgi:phage terminase large subunit-like protein